MCLDTFLKPSIDHCSVFTAIFYVSSQKKMVRICAVIGCSNSTAKLEKWYSQLCEIHGLHFGSCVCEPPFRLFPFPTEARDPAARKRWINLVNRKTKDGHDWQPSYQDRVCSVHFLESEPTPKLPDPTEFLGYDNLQSRSFYSTRKLPRDPPEESLPFREIVVQEKAPKRRRRQGASSKVQKKSKNNGEGSLVVIATGMHDSKEEQELSADETLSKQEQHIDHSYCDVKTIQFECKGCSEKLAQINELQGKVQKLELELKLSKNQLEVAESMHMGSISVHGTVCNVPKSDKVRRRVSDEIPAKTETERHSSSSDPEKSRRKGRAGKEKGLSLRSRRKGKKTSKTS